MTTVKDMVKEWLENHGYSGLYDDFECGCGIDCLMPCGEPRENCSPGYRVPCDPETNDGVDFITVPDKPPVKSRLIMARQGALK